MKSAAERQKTYRVRRIERGWKRFSVWAHPLDWPKIKRLAQQLEGRRKP